MPESWFSIGAATVRDSVWALAPSYCVEIVTVGGVMLGYCDRGRARMATMPASTIRMERTVAKIGRRIHRSLSMVLGLRP